MSAFDRSLWDKSGTIPFEETPRDLESLGVPDGRVTELGRVVRRSPETEIVDAVDVCVLT